MCACDQVVVIGASGFGRESLDVLGAMQKNGTNVEILGVVDDTPSEANLERLRERGVSYLGTVNEWLKTRPSDVYFVVGIGNPLIRRQLALMLETAEITPYYAIHPSVSIGSNPNFLPGLVICAGVSISTNVKLGQHVHINPNATIGHDAVLENFVSINPAAVISGEVKIRENVLIGAAALVLQQLTVGEGATIGAGAVVTKNVPSKVVVKGVPGRWGQE